MNMDRMLVGRLFSYFWRFKLTRLGKTLMFFGFISGAFIAWSVDILTFPFFATMFCLGAVAATVNFLWRTRLRMALQLPDRIVAGALASGTVTVHNVGTLPAYDVGASFFSLPAGLCETSTDTYIAVLPPGAEARLPIEIKALRRGNHALPALRAFSAFPLRLLRSGSSTQQVGALLALPAFTPLEHIDVPVGHRYQPGGVALTAHVGESPEYVGNREFRAGDSIRRLDMRAWGRIGIPIVREYHEEYFLRLALVLDTFAPRSFRRHIATRERLEAAISLTAAVVDAFSRGEYLLDIFAAGPELYTFRTGRGAAQFDTVLDILAGVEACSADPFEQIAPALAEELANISTVLFVFLDWDDARRAMVRTAVECGCCVRVFIVHEGETTMPYADDGEYAITALTPALVRNGEASAL